MPPLQPQPPEDRTLLERVLGPLLDDFRYWFKRSLDLLEKEPLQFLSVDQQATLIERLRTALSETQTAAALLEATNGQVGVDTSQVMAWHALVAECWLISRKRRSEMS